MSPAPVQRSRNSPLPLKNVLLPPHFVSMSTPLSPASQEPDCTSTGCAASTGITAMSPGRSGATHTSPPFGARNVLMKNVVPPSTERLSPERTPPRAFVSTSTPSVIDAMAPASTRRSPPGGMVTVAKENAGLATMSTCMRRPYVRLEHALHDHDIEPLAELAPDLALGAHDLEPAPPVHRDRRVVPADDARDHRVVAVLLREAYELGEELPPDSRAAVVVADVDRVLHRREVRGPFLVRRQRAEAHDRVGVIEGDDRGVAAAVLLDPGDLVLEAPGHEVERDRRARDLCVVDDPDRVGVGAIRGSEAGGHGSGRYRTASRLLVFPGSSRDRSGWSARPLSSVGRALPW